MNQLISVIIPFQKKSEKKNRNVPALRVCHTEAGHLAFFFRNDVRYDLIVETCLKINR